MEGSRISSTIRAVFFDLDRTLMQGSSAFQFGRAAYKAGVPMGRGTVMDQVAERRRDREESA